MSVRAALRIAVWGLGLIGGSLAAALKERAGPPRVVGIDREEVIRRALEVGLIARGHTVEDFREGVRDADLLVLATPLEVILEVLERIGPFLRPGTLVTDVGSTKQRIVETARTYLPGGITFIGGHPMTGSERRGLAAADAHLFEDAVWVLTPDPTVPEAPLRMLTGVIEGVGARVVLEEPARHDRIVARISHLPQILAVALMNRVGRWHGEDDRTLRLAAGGFRDLTRIAASPWEIWAGIHATNGEAIREALDAFIRELLEVRERLEGYGLEGDFIQAARWRRLMPSSGERDARRDGV